MVDGSKGKSAARPARMEVSGKPEIVGAIKSVWSHGGRINGRLLTACCERRSQAVRGLRAGIDGFSSVPRNLRRSA
jgi:hypothetical protein